MQWLVVGFVSCVSLFVVGLGDSFSLCVCVCVRACVCVDVTLADTPILFFIDFSKHLWEK